MPAKSAFSCSREFIPGIKKITYQLFLIFIIKGFYAKKKLTLFLCYITCRDTDNFSEFCINSGSFIQFIREFSAINFELHFMFPQLPPVFIQLFIFRDNRNCFNIKKQN